MMNIVLHEPEMPANTGNIGRTDPSKKIEQL
jgi:tRNA(Leu) C34 or U34 (ribose-2'-O)-methylase TrmL